MNVKKRTRLLAFVLICMIYVSACRNRAIVNEPNTEVTGIPTKAVITTTVPEPTIQEFHELKELSIYSIDGQTAEKVILTAVVSSESDITPQLIVEKVVESMADETFMIGIDSVTCVEDAVIVSFLDNQPPVINVGSSVESEILDAIAQSLLDNLEGKYHKVIYQVMGKAYTSGHYRFDLNQVYLESQ